MEKLLETFKALKQKNLSIDLTRGKPHSDQLDLSNDLMTQACLLYTSPSPRDR